MYSIKYIVSEVFKFASDVQSTQKGLVFIIISDDWCTLDRYCMPDDESVIFSIQTLVFYYHVLLWKVALESFDWSFQKVKKKKI